MNQRVHELEHRTYEVIVSEEELLSRNKGFADLFKSTYQTIGNDLGWLTRLNGAIPFV